MSSARLYLTIGLGGALGTALRVALSWLALAHMPAFAYLATLVANMLGAALIGYLATRILTTGQKALWMAGFCGGFTTFSLFSLEIVTLMERSVTEALVYGSASLVLWIFAVWGGWRLGQG